MDSYDQAHSTTGSGNISKTTPEWLEVLDIARERYQEQGDPVLHIAYQVIREQVMMGKPWSKCMNCGSPYRVTGDTMDNLCSSQCYKEYVAYITGGL